MKRLPQCLLALLLLLHFPARAVDIFVAANGADTNDGSKGKPLATITAALRKARELRRLNDVGVAGGIHIIVRYGVYHITESITIRPEDAGTKESPTYIEAAPNETPVLDGGFTIGNWKKTLTKIAGLPAAAQGNIWEAAVPLSAGRLCEFRQLWVNDSKAVRAKSMNGDLMDRILSWDKKEQTCWIPTPKTPALQQVAGAEMFIHQWWAIAILRIKKMEPHGDSTKLFFEQPESKIQSEHPWPAPWISKETGNSAFYLSNAIQFLDEPGEWFLDVAKQKIYYWPRANENMATATVVAPLLETLVKIEGTIDRRVSYVYISNISFAHTGWLRPGQQGHVPHQLGLYMTEAYKLRPAGTPLNAHLDNQAWVGRPPAAVALQYAAQIKIEHCKFEHLASTGLDLKAGTAMTAISGNLLRDIGGNGILAGNFGDEGREIHLPYFTTNENEICAFNWIQNNLVTNVGNEDWGCAGIAVGFAKNMSIQHNEIENVPYTGISLGWGWTAEENVMRYNLVQANTIHHFGMHNYDCAGIYTQSNQPGTKVQGNYIDSIYKAPYAHLPSHWFYLYADEGSSGIAFADNWTPSAKYLQNANGPGNEWHNNGPEVSDSIKQNAGLQKAYQYLLAGKTAKANLPINKEHNEVIELVTKAGEKLDVQKLKNILAANTMDSTAVYQWQNHYVIFDKVVDVGVMQGRLQNNFPTATVKVYPDMFYEFNRTRCDDKNVAAEWDHILLTCNLVADKKKQAEYLNYHATQFEQWPEISKGFCNASFQQLLIFKHGRQLVLVISIPKGESLDKLNPKTTENNPRVNDWNKIMSKYQEGIEGTKKGETWVFLKNVK
ncbi:L-rhamnose mutarotase [Ferruginibacter sp. SUN106]|uniref:L-rhamnose mutarotase n=1 Tax=Ferruginibacter sp. SUN106 TaxID=2978348 RepID=UPI003D362ADC